MVKRPSKTAVEQRMIGESCIQCHACCHHLVVKITDKDIEREPRLALQAEKIEQGKYRLMPWQQGRLDWIYYCPFLHTWGCEIYPTRPDACLSFKRGGQACLEQRKGHLRYANQN